MKNAIVFSSFLLIFNLISCTKQDVQILPSESRTGAGTFACIYNDNVLVLPKDFGYAYLMIDTFLNEKNLRIYGFISNTEDPGIICLSVVDSSLYLNSFYSFKLTSYPASAAVGMNTVNFLYRTDMENQGMLEITNFDIKNGIVSGRFSFNAIGYSGNAPTISPSPPNPFSNYKLKVSSGRFDVKMETWYKSH